ncbi:MAG TPA: PQQ-dependent sugar dehydrogenase [Tepidisphaeraceae bacterium]|jgi:putative heme-binding domain-containing protein|nr:PQQ-dependent sugar dehydrogenase [Tepidisphaeraceae bacterium]
MTRFAISRLTISVLLTVASAACAAGPVPATQPSREAYRIFAMVHQGDPEAGKALFLEPQKIACSQCHTTDGKGGKAGPDLFAIGDKYGRDDLIQQVLLPSSSIAVGYSTTVIRTKSGDLFQGIVKESNDRVVGLMGSDGKLLRIKTSDIDRQRTTDVSLMPEGLEGALTKQQFADLIAFLASLKAPQSMDAALHGMPREIPALMVPVALQQINSPQNAFKHPVWFGAVPGLSDSYAVVEHETGTIWLYRKNGSQESKTKFLEIGPALSGTRGVVGMTFHPKFAENRKYYIVRHTAQGGRFPSSVLQGLASADLKSDSGEPLKPIITFQGVTNSDHGGGLAFGPDGYLYVGMGDSGPGGDPEGHGQDLSVPLAKILRIDVDHCDSGKGYSVPSDNPFVHRTGVCPEIWAYGLREPWRFSFDSLTHDLWVADVGQDLYEEIDIVRKGENYGWNVMEGFERYSNRYRRENETVVPPIFSWTRKYGQAGIGGFVYRGNPKSSFYGVYIFGDYQKKAIFALTQKDRVLNQVRLIARLPQSVVSFGQDAGGHIYAVGYEGNIYMLDLDSARFE